MNSVLDAKSTGSLVRTGYILNPRADAIWFIGLPFIGILVAMASQRWATQVAIASFGLWITLPHHFATWVRTYGISDEWQYYKARLIVGPIVIAAMTLVGLVYAPLTLLLLIAMWDHQHSLMQQHGFSRIYDFKAGTGAPSTRKFDLAFNAILYANLFLTTPFFTEFWVREFYNFEMPIGPQFVRIVHITSWTVTIGYSCVYLGHLIWARANGYALNPIKYAFLAASFTMWYFVAWQSDSVLIYGVSHKIMHGVQYIIIVLIYLQRRRTQEEMKLNLFHPANVTVFFIMAFIYAVLFQLITVQPLDGFAFGFFEFPDSYNKPIPALGLKGMTETEKYTVFASMVVFSTQLMHYYFDSFIWKVRDKKTQSGL